MIVTEEEAKTKRCQESFPAAEGLSPHGGSEAVPMTTVLTGSQAAGYSAYGGGYARHTAPVYCIGSACMAWRWEAGTSDDEQYLSGKCFEYVECEERPGDRWELCADPEEMSITGMNVWRRLQIPKGYCGKAGKP